MELLEEWHAADSCDDYTGKDRDIDGNVPNGLIIVPALCAIVVTVYTKGGRARDKACVPSHPNTGDPSRPVCISAAWL